MRGREGEGEGEGAEGEGSASGVLHAEGEGEGASEGEGVEGEGAGVSLAADDAGYLYQLSMIEGHLAAFAALYEAGDIDQALTHAKHPESEIYSGLIPALETRRLPGFAEELTALVDAGESGEAVMAAYQQARDAIAANSPSATAFTSLMAISQLVTTAGEEFSIGVGDDGAIVNAHEYQDAYGFLTAAKRHAAHIQGANAEEIDAISTTREQIDLALEQFDGWTPTQSSGDGSVIYGAAARIEIAALGLQ